jgi:NAD(P)H-hydrate repair Nnr-like enzyme with NAD(P)H-hydrate dehydratase domain
MVILIEINKGVQQGCPLSSVLFNIYIDRVITDWLQVMKQSILAKDITLNTVLFMDDQVIMTSTEDEVQRVVYAWNNIAIKCNLKIAANKTKTIVVKGKMNVRAKVVIIT